MNKLTSIAVISRPYTSGSNDGDCRAYFQEKPALWAEGKSSREAIGNLICSHGMVFGIKVRLPAQVSPEGTIIMPGCAPPVK